MWQAAVSYKSVSKWRGNIVLKGKKQTSTHQDCLIKRFLFHSGSLDGLPDGFEIVALPSGKFCLSLYLL